MTIGDLTARHLGQRIRIPGLHDPRSDWDAPEITVEGVLTWMGEAGLGRGTVLIRLRKATGAFHEVLTLDHPCEVIE